MKAEISWKYDVPLVRQNYHMKTKLEMSYDDGRASSTAGVLIHLLLLYSLVLFVAVTWMWCQPTSLRYVSLFLVQWI